MLWIILRSPRLPGTAGRAASGRCPRSPEELVVRARTRRSGPVDDQDRVGVADRGQPVGDDERRPVLHDAGQGLLDQPLGLGIEGRGRFVQDEDRRVLEQGPGEGQPLPLADREEGAPLADRRVVSLGKLRDEVMAFGRLGRGDRSVRSGRRPGRRRCWLRTVSLNRTMSWVTSPICDRSEARVTSRMSIPSIVIRPEVGS